MNWSKVWPGLALEGEPVTRAHIFQGVYHSVIISTGSTIKKNQDSIWIVFSQIIKARSHELSGKKSVLQPAGFFLSF